MIKKIQTLSWIPSESYSCWALVDKYKMDTSRAETRRTKVWDSYWFLFLWEEGRGAWGASLIHVTRHLRLAASSTCSQSTNPFCLPWAGPTVPIHVDRHSVRACASSASALSVFRALHNEHMRNHGGPETDSARKQLICFTTQQGKLQVQWCSIDSGVKSVELIPPLPPMSCLHLLTSFSGTEYLSWIIK